MLLLGVRQVKIGVQRLKAKEEKNYNKLGSKKEVEEVDGGNYTIDASS
jgi:hypothetical protein